MLVLSRKCEQSLLIGEDITITILAIDGERVKLGIEAPRSVTVLRTEVHDQLQIAKADAAHALDPAEGQTIGKALGRTNPGKSACGGVTGSSFSSVNR